MECPFKTPAKYEMKITNTEYIIVDAERKVIAKCNYEDDALFIQEVINSHEKLVEALQKIVDDHPAGLHPTEPASLARARQALKAEEK